MNLYNKLTFAKNTKAIVFGASGNPDISLSIVEFLLHKMLKNILCIKN